MWELGLLMVLLKKKNWVLPNLFLELYLSFERSGCPHENGNRGDFFRSGDHCSAEWIVAARFRRQFGDLSDCYWRCFFEDDTAARVSRMGCQNCHTQSLMITFAFFFFFSSSISPIQQLVSKIHNTLWQISSRFAREKTKSWNCGNVKATRTKFWKRFDSRKLFNHANSKIASLRIIASGLNFFSVSKTTMGNVASESSILEFCFVFL